MPDIELTVDDVVVRVPPGATLLEAADLAGVPIPRLCHVPGVQSRAVCRLCMVEAGGKTVAACATPALVGLEVRTRTEAVAEIRRAVMTLTLAEHGGPCGVAGCEVCALALEVGVTTDDLRSGSSEDLEVDATSDYLRLEHRLCVHCDRCITACRDRATLAHVGRGAASRVAFDGGAASDSSCVVCGDCVAACPAGALTATAAQVHEGDPLLADALPAREVEPAPFAFTEAVGFDLIDVPAPPPPPRRAPAQEPEDDVPFAMTMAVGVPIEPVAPAPAPMPVAPPPVAPPPVADPDPPVLDPPEMEGGRRRKTIFIAAVVVFQLLLPVRYYASDDAFDERFAWRMFSPIRVVKCEAKWTEGAARSRVIVSRDVPFIWTTLMKRARLDVFAGYAKHRCEKLEAGGDVAQVYVDLVCHHPDGEPRRPIPPDHNLCGGLP